MRDIADGTLKVTMTSAKCLQFLSDEVKFWERGYATGRVITYVNTAGADNDARMQIVFDFRLKRIKYHVLSEAVGQADEARSNERFECSLRFVARRWAAE